jgi:hypothetical protein
MGNEKEARGYEFTMQLKDYVVNAVPLYNILTYIEFHYL